MKSIGSKVLTGATVLLYIGAMPPTSQARFDAGFGLRLQIRRKAKNMTL